MYMVYVYKYFSHVWCLAGTFEDAQNTNLEYWMNANEILSRLQRMSQHLDSAYEAQCLIISNEFCFETFRVIFTRDQTTLSTW